LCGNPGYVIVGWKSGSLSFTLSSAGARGKQARHLAAALNCAWKV
jgi:hypothetical protein